MKIAIDRLSGKIQSISGTDYVSENLIVVGQIDRLHVGISPIWHPTVPRIESFFESISTDQVAEQVASVEGQYLAILHKDHKLFVFCDRYCLKTVYYRLTKLTIELFDTILADKDGGLSVSQENAIVFLLLRYVPGRQTLFDGISRMMPGDCLVLDTKTGHLSIETTYVYPKRDIGSVDEHAAAETFHHFFREALEARIGRYSAEEKLLIPLSGGFDSRYVLGTALELVSPSRIIGVTFGQLGSYDFEIGRTVALAAGVSHEAYPLSPADYNPESLEQGCMDCDGQIAFTTEAPVSIFKQLRQFGTVNLSGYVGDAIMGNKAHAPSGDGKFHIVLKNSLAGNFPLLAGYFAPQLLENSFYFQNTTRQCSLDTPEMWFFINHFTKYTNPCVFKNRQDLTYINPFIDYAFLDYVLNLPLGMRLGRRIYFAWLEHHFPDLAAIPCKLYRGASLTSSQARKFITLQLERFNELVLGKNRRTNKIDFHRYRLQILEPQEMRKRMAGLLPAEFERKIFGDERYSLLLYNLKCLDILCTRFGVRFN